jgi:hypothetical protein
VNLRLYVQQWLQRVITITDSSAFIVFFSFCSDSHSSHLVLVAQQIDTCNFNFVLPGGPPCAIPANFTIDLASPTFVFDGPLILNCTGSGQQLVGVCGGISVDCNGFTVTNIGSDETAFFFGGDRVENCDLRNTTAGIAPQGNSSSVVNTKISGGVGLVIGNTNLSAVVTLKDVEVTNTAEGIIQFQNMNNITAVFDNVFSCGNMERDVLVAGGTFTKWDITCNDYDALGIPGLACPGTCPDAC